MEAKDGPERWLILELLYLGMLCAILCALIHSPSILASCEGCIDVPTIAAVIPCSPMVTWRLLHRLKNSSLNEGCASSDPWVYHQSLVRVTDVVQRSFILTVSMAYDA